jgi:membrane associated rhomboid family serine protease
LLAPDPRAMHGRFVSGRVVASLGGRLRDFRSARWTAGLVFVLLLVHAAVVSLDDADPVFMRYGLWRDGGPGGRPWQWASYAMLHGNGWHLAVNAVGLLLIGSRVERIGGPRVVPTVFFSGVLVGGLAQMLLAPPVQQGVPLVGASGGVMALLLWLTTVAPDARTRPFGIAARNLGLGVVVAEAALLAAAWLLPDAEFQPLAHACHLGGAAAGWAIARRRFRMPPGLDQLQRERARRESADGPSKLP